MRYADGAGAESAGFRHSSRRVMLPLAFLGAGLALLFSATSCGGARTNARPCNNDTECGTGMVCGEDKVCVAATGGETLGQGCSVDTECPTGTICVDGSCVAGDSGPCSRHEDCALGSFCRFSTQECVGCLNNDHCPIGEICLGNGSCGVEGSDDCETNDDCGGLVCSGGTCVPCTTSNDCLVGQTCRDSQCVSNDGGNPTCETQADCAVYGYICDEVENRCEPCENDTQCGAGQTCDQGVCQGSTGGGPGGGGGGGSGGLCLTTADCEEGIPCVLAVCTPCFDDLLCNGLGSLLTGPRICEIETGKCVPPECSAAADCPAGEACWGAGHCGQCIADEECRPGETCNTGSGVCEAS